MDERVIRCLVVSDFNPENFCGLLNNGQTGPIIRATAGPYGQVFELLLDASSRYWSERPEMVVVWTSPETAVPSFRAVLDFHTVPLEQLLEEVDRYTKNLLGLAGLAPMVLVPTWVLPPLQRGLGPLDLKHAGGAAGVLLQMNAR